MNTADSLSIHPTVVLVGAGFSLTAGLPTAFQFIQAVLDALIHSPAVRRMDLRDVETAHVKQVLSRIEFDAALGVLRRSGPGHYDLLFKAFTEGKPTEQSVAFMKLCASTRIKAVFTTNFDLVLERTAYHLGIDVCVFADDDKFPESVIPDDPLPIFKIHGSAAEGAHPIQPAADFCDIASTKDSPKGATLKRYLQTHHLVVLGYGGADVWDVYPLIYEYARQSVCWVDHVASDEIVVTGHDDAFSSLELKDHIDRLLAAQPDRWRIKTDTSALVSAMWQRCASTIGRSHECEVLIPTSNRDAWQGHVDAWAAARGDAALVDLAMLLNATGENEVGTRALEAYISSPSAKPDCEVALALEARATNAGLGSPSSSNPKKDYAEARHIAERSKDHALLTWILIEEGIYTGNDSDPVVAAEIFRRAKDAAVRADCREALGFAEANLANQLSRLGEIASAERAYLRAVEAFGEAGNMPQVALTLYNIAERIYGPNSPGFDFEKTLEYYLTFLARSWGRNILMMQKWTAYNHAMALKIMHEGGIDVVTYIASRWELQMSGVAEHMIHCMSEGKFHAPVLPNEPLESWTHRMSEPPSDFGNTTVGRREMSRCLSICRDAVIHMNECRFSEALPLFEEEERILRKYEGESPGLCQNLRNQGLVFKGLGDPVRGIEVLKEATHLAERLDLADLRAHSLLLMAEIEYDCGTLAAAKRLLGNAREFTDHPKVTHEVKQGIAQLRERLASN